MSVRPRDLPGRDVLQSLQKFEWRFQTLEQDLENVLASSDPNAGESAIQPRYTNRNELYDAERRLHHYLSGYYTFKSLTTTLAKSAPNPEFAGRVKRRRDHFANNETSRVILGMRHYVQHHNILPIIIKMSSISEERPRYAISKQELEMADFDYRIPQMTLDLSHYDDGFNYYFEAVDEVVIYPFMEISRNWEEVESLREDVYELARSHLEEEIEEYVDQLRELMRMQEKLRKEHEEMAELIDMAGILTPELDELLTPELYDQLLNFDR